MVLLVPHWLLIRKQKAVEKPKLVLTFPRAEVTGVPIFSSKNQVRVARLYKWTALGRPKYLFLFKILVKYM